MMGQNVKYDKGGRERYCFVHRGCVQGGNLVQKEL